jgi:hypothetical protein
MERPSTVWTTFEKTDGDGTKSTVPVEANEKKDTVALIGKHL